LDDLGLYFVVQSNIEGKLVTDELVAGGSNLQVTKDNLDQLIKMR
jgi:hypothetical protein